jgi:gas vesicle protein
MANPIWSAIETYIAATRLPDLIVVALLTYFLANANNMKKENRDNQTNLEDTVEKLTLEKLEINLTRVITDAVQGVKDELKSEIQGVKDELKSEGKGVKDELLPIKQNLRDLANELRYKGIITQTEPLDISKK